MAEKIRGITIELGADTSGITKGLADVNKEIKSTQSQLSDVERLLKLDPTNTELLAQKQKLLSQSVQESAKKVEVLRQAEQKLKDSGVDENSAQFLSLKREIAATEINSKKYEKQLAETEDALNGETNAIKEEEKALDKSGKAADETDKKHGNLGKTLAAVGAGFTAVAAAAGAALVKSGKALAEMTTQGAEYADTVLTESTVTGIATDKLQEYMYAAELVDVSVETLTGSMRKNIAAMKNARNGSESVSSAYESLGISVTNADGSLRNSEDVYWEVIDALGKIENETERDSLAMTLLGKSAQELNPLIKAGAAGMNQFAAEAQAVGYVLSEDTLKAYGALDDNLQRLANTTTALKNGLGQILLPIMTAFTGDAVDLMGDLSNGISEANGDISQIGVVIEKVMPKALQMVKKYVPQVLEIVKTVIKTLLQVITESLPDIINAGSDILLSLIEGITDNLPAITDAALTLILTLVDGLIRALPSLAEAAVKVITTLVEGIGNALPTLIPAAVKAITTIVRGLIDNLPMIIDAALKLIAGLAEGLVDAIPVLLDEVPKIISSLVKTLTADGVLAKLAKAGVTLLVSLIDKLPDIIDSLVDAVIELVGALVDAFLADDTLSKIMDAGVTLLVSLVEKLPDIITKIVDKLPQIITSIIEALTNPQTITKMFTAGITLFKALVSNVPKIIASLASGLWEIVTGIFDSLTNGEALAKLMEAGKQLFIALWEGLKSVWSQIKSWFTQLWDALFGSDGEVRWENGHVVLPGQDIVNGNEYVTSAYKGGSGRLNQEITQAQNENVVGEYGPVNEATVINIELTGSMATLAQQANPYFYYEQMRTGYTLVR